MVSCGLVYADRLLRRRGETPMTSMDEQRKLKQEKIKAEMPVFMHGPGVWAGMSRHLDAEGKLIAQHRSRLLIRFAEEGLHPILQTNLYYWDDGRVEKREFPVDYANRRLVYDNALIKGYFTEIAED